MQNTDQLFSQLTSKRKNTVQVLREEGMLNVFISHIVDTYRDSAHFIYELFQNADDALATSARLELTQNGILFAHNGKINFTISDPSVERTDGITPGHINAITTFSLSTKKEDIENKIGKFGIGFKSVFQYTQTPHIYNLPYSFKIEDFMIPSQIEYRQDLLMENETTAFWLPFDKVEKPSDQACREISEKLALLKNPLLFLRSLSEVSVNNLNSRILFSKSSNEITDLDFPDLRISKVYLNSDLILLFDKTVTITDESGITHNLPINVGFVVDKKGNISASAEFAHYYKFAWCFFPTTQETRMNYIINAPFVLTPSREAFRESRKENQQLVSHLKELAAIALDILKLLGYINETFFTTIAIPDNIPHDLRPIGMRIIEVLKTGKFIPFEKSHIDVSDAYLCTDNELSYLLSYKDYEPLKKITGKQGAKIVFRDGKLFEDRNLYVYFYKTLTSEKSELQTAWFGAKFNYKLLQDVDKDFYILFFKFISSRSNVILANNQPLWKKQFIPVHDGEKIYLVQPFNSQKEPHIYISSIRKAGRYVIPNYLADDPAIRPFLENVLKCMVPDEFDDFMDNLDKYESNLPDLFQDASADIITIRDFYFKASENRKQKLLDKLAKLFYLPVMSDQGNNELGNPTGTVIYFPGDKLRKYFSKAKLNVNWVDVKCHRDLLENMPGLEKFFTDLGVEFEPYFDNPEIDGLSAYLEDLSLDESVYLASLLIRKRFSENFRAYLEPFRKNDWLFDKNGIKSYANEIKYGDIHVNYPVEMSTIHLELGALTEAETTKYNLLSSNEKAVLVALGGSLDNLTPEEIKGALQGLINRKKKEKEVVNVGDADTFGNSYDPRTPRGLLNSWTERGIERSESVLNNEISGGNKNLSIPKNTKFWEDNEDDTIDNQGDFGGAAVIGKKYQKDIELQQQEIINNQIDLNYKRNQLIDLAGKSEPYSFGWFKTLLELEDNFTAEDRVRRNPINITFGSAMFNEDNILVLSGAAYIPPSIEDIGDVSVQLFINDEKTTLKGEILSPKRTELSVRIANPEQINSLKTKNISRAIVEASSPDFILERLKNAFARLPFDDADNLRDPAHLPADLKFIFGPPGTGKTTYLSLLIGGKNKLALDFCGADVHPLMNEEKKVLVLTPTNKAGDVLTERIIDNYLADGEHPDWLIRFGQTETLEYSAYFVGDRKMPSWIEEKCTVVTTIARFPYDYFNIMDRGELVKDSQIRSYSWDVIVFDEASMINQSAILYVIYYARQINPKVQFYIGGDPFQIPPIIQFEYPYWSYIPEQATDSEGQPIKDNEGNQLEWKQDGGNIYSFIDLMKDDSFNSLKTFPHQFQVHKLMTQYRSLKPIGTLFSHYRYNGLLEHARTETAITANPLIAPKEMHVSSLPLGLITLIRYPVNRFGGICRARTIKGSPYHIYSAIFSTELIQYIQDNIKVSNSSTYKIGLISPYSTQNKLISKLIGQLNLTNVEINCGTVHGFQGDECDLVIVMLNPPRNITRSPRSFLNKKNILNVAISRARDKMIILTPYDPDNELNFNDLHQIKYIEKLAGKLPDVKEHVIGYDATDLEYSLWGDKNYIDKITLSTTHQDVNIYKKAIKKYELRTNEMSIDVQILT